MSMVSFDMTLDDMINHTRNSEPLRGQDRPRGPPRGRGPRGSSSGASAPLGFHVRQMIAKHESRGTSNLLFQNARLLQDGLQAAGLSGCRLQNDQLSQDGVRATGVNSEIPDMRGYAAVDRSPFREFLLKPELLRVVEESGLGHPSQVQRRCIPRAISRMNLICETLDDQKSEHLGAAMDDADGASEPKTKCCARKWQRRYLPQEIVFNILLHLPAQVLYDVMRHVCKEWNLIISSQNFIRRHLRSSTRGMIIQKLSPDFYGIYVEMRRGCLEIREFDSGFEDVTWSSCNGLVLAHDCRDDHILYVINPLTKQRAILPPYMHHIGCHADFCLAFVEASMQYKVVHARDCEFALKQQIAVLTVGVDKVWRYIDVGTHAGIRRNGFFTSLLPCVTGAYVHWIGLRYVLTLNVETETISFFRLPQLWYGHRKFLPMGSSLSVIYECNSFLRDVWEMNPETGEWIQLLRFDLRPVCNKFEVMFPEYRIPVVPFGWLEVREVLVFSWLGIQRCCVAYNLKTREMRTFELDPRSKINRFQVHVDSLVWLEGAL